ncbi:MAG: hypothetical protein ACREV6_19420 [Clostridium sp.]|uniref:hypothetical protein n=1 Tax=Clostridium sp. TaxID=1506 RepID=UPI003D6DA179
MEKSSFFNSINGDRKYKANDFAEFFNSLLTNGVLPNPSTNLQVIANNNMTITVKMGKAWINGKIYINDSDLILPVSVADGVLNRIDRIVIRLDTLARNIKIIVKKGTFASVPVAPVLQRDADFYELGIADIYIARGATSISQANITDLRLNSVYCGWANSLMQADTTALFNQYQDWLNNRQAQYNKEVIDWTAEKHADFTTWEATSKQTYTDVLNKEVIDVAKIETDFQASFTAWFNAIKGQLSTDAAGNLQLEINDLSAELDSHLADNVQQMINLKRKIRMGGMM